MRLIIIPINGPVVCKPNASEEDIIEAVGENPTPISIENITILAANTQEYNFSEENFRTPPPLNFNEQATNIVRNTKNIMIIGNAVIADADENIFKYAPTI